MKIVIRKVVPGDEKSVADFIKLSLKKGFFNYLRTNTPPSKETLKRMRKNYASKNKNTCIFVAVDLEKNIIVGAASFKGLEDGRTRHIVEAGWFVHYAYAGNGIGTLLLKNLITEAKKRKIRRIEANVAVKNVASIKLAKKFGFKLEGIKKDGLLLDNGKYIDKYMFAKILK